MSEKDLIIAMDTERLQEFIDTKKDRRNDLWRAASEMEQEAARLKRSGNDMNWEIAIASVELKKRADQVNDSLLQWNDFGDKWRAVGSKGHRYEIDADGPERAPYEFYLNDSWRSDWSTLDRAKAAAIKCEKQATSQ